MAVRLSHACTWGRSTKPFSSNRKAPVLAQMKQERIYSCKFRDVGKPGCFFMHCMVSRISSLPGGFLCPFLLAQVTK